MQMNMQIELAAGQTAALEAGRLLPVRPALEKTEGTLPAANPLCVARTQALETQRAENLAWLLLAAGGALMLGLSLFA